MSVQTYSELRAQLKHWTRRTDIDRIFDTMIELVEGQIYKGDKGLRVRELIHNSTSACTIDDRTLTLPTDYLELINLEIVVGTKTYDLKFISVSDMPSQVYAGRPYRFTITDKIVFDALPDSAYTIKFSYFRRLPKLTDATETNALLTAYPDLYFFGLQAAIFDYASEPELSSIKKQVFDEILGGANHTFKMSNFGPDLKMAGGSYCGGIRMSTNMRRR